jgi:hypothetical protein
MSGLVANSWPFVGFGLLAAPPSSSPGQRGEAQSPHPNLCCAPHTETAATDLSQQCSKDPSGPDVLHKDLETYTEGGPDC